MPKNLILAVMLLVMAPFFVVGGPTALDPPIWSDLLNLAHIVFFAVATFLTWSLLPARNRGRPWLLLAICSFAAVLLGLLIEGLQARFARDPDWHDVWRNLLGVWLAWFVIIRPDVRFRGIARALVVALLACELALVIHSFAIEWRIQHQQPLLADFEHARESAYWSTNTERSRDVASHGDYSLEVRLDTSLYSGTGPRRFPRDWRGWERLALDVYNPDPDTLKLTLLVGDREHYVDGYAYENRFNRRLWAASGWNTYRIPLAEIAAAPAGRAMDLGDIVSLGIFATRLPAPRVIYLDHLRLE